MKLAYHKNKVFSTLVIFITWLVFKTKLKRNGYSHLNHELNACTCYFMVFDSHAVLLASFLFFIQVYIILKLFVSKVYSVYIISFSLYNFSYNRHTIINFNCDNDLWIFLCILFWFFFPRPYLSSPSISSLCKRYYLWTRRVAYPSGTNKKMSDAKTLMVKLYTV